MAAPFPPPPQHENRSRALAGWASSLQPTKSRTRSGRRSTADRIVQWRKASSIAGHRTDRCTQHGRGHGQGHTNPRRGTLRDVRTSSDVRDDRDEDRIAQWRKASSIAGHRTDRCTRHGRGHGQGHTNPRRCTIRDVSRNCPLL